MALVLFVFFCVICIFSCD